MIKWTYNAIYRIVVIAPIRPDRLLTWRVHVLEGIHKEVKRRLKYLQHPKHLKSDLLDVAPWFEIQLWVELLKCLLLKVSWEYSSSHCYLDRALKLALRTSTTRPMQNSSNSSIIPSFLLKPHSTSRLLRLTVMQRFSTKTFQKFNAHYFPSSHTTNSFSFGVLPTCILLFIALIPFAKMYAIFIVD